MNKKLLKSEMARYGDTGNTLAKYLGISPGTLSNKINENGTEFNKSEMELIKARYNLDADTFTAIFFTDDVS